MLELLWRLLIPDAALSDWRETVCWCGAYFVMLGYADDGRAVVRCSRLRGIERPHEQAHRPSA